MWRTWYCPKTCPTGSCGNHPVKMLCTLRWFAIITRYLFSCCLFWSVSCFADTMHLPSLCHFRPGVISVAIMDFIMLLLELFSLKIFWTYICWLWLWCFCCPPYLKWSNAPVNVLLCFTKKNIKQDVKPDASQQTSNSQPNTNCIFISVILECLILPQSFNNRVCFSMVKSICKILVCSAEFKDWNLWPFILATLILAFNWFINHKISSWGLRNYILIDRLISSLFKMGLFHRNNLLKVWNTAEMVIWVITFNI